MRIALMAIAFGGFLFGVAPGMRRAEARDEKARISLLIYSGEKDPSWEPSDGDAKDFAVKFDKLKARDAQKPLSPVLGYRGFTVKGFRSYDRIWIWEGTVEATRDGKTYQWDDEGRALEKHLLKSSKGHVSEKEYETAADAVEKN